MIRYTNVYSPDIYSVNYYNTRFAVELRKVFCIWELQVDRLKVKDWIDLQNQLVRVKMPHYR
jgi:hypothetical protein